MSAAGEMDCKELVELVTSYFDGALSRADADRFEAHLAECDACVDYVLQLRLTIRAVEASALPDQPVVRELLRVFRDWKRCATSGGLASQSATQQPT